MHISYFIIVVKVATARLAKKSKRYDKHTAIPYITTTENPPTLQSIRQSLLPLSAWLKKLKKEQSSKEKDLLTSSLLNESYHLSRCICIYKSKISTCTPICTPVCSSCSENKALNVVNYNLAKNYLSLR